MSRLLAAILGEPEKAMTNLMNKLELAAGHPSEDLRLLNRSQQSAKDKIAQLGLDSKDTTAEELYHTMLSKYAQASKTVDRTLGQTADSSSLSLAQKSVNLTKHLVGESDSWSLKHQAVAKLLRVSPPKQLMKQLNYRSVDSLLKRESPTAVILMAEQVESKAWNANLSRSIKQLTSSDYALQPIDIQVLSGKVDKAGTALNKSVAAVGLWPGSVKSIVGSTVELMQALDSIGIKTNQIELAKLHPALHWWQGSSLLFHANDSEVVSMNLRDTITNHSKSFDFNQRTTQHLQKSFWQNLTSQYHQHTAEASDIIDHWRQIPVDLEAPKMVPEFVEVTE